MSNYKDSAELLIELCKQINMCKFLKRQIVDIRIKVYSRPKFRKSKISVSSVLAPEEQLLTEELSTMRTSLYRVAFKILRKNNLTDKDIKLEDFELGSSDLMEGHCELLSADGNKIFFYCIVDGIIVPYDTEEDKKKAHNVLAKKKIPNLMNFIQFVNLPPF